MGLFLDRRIKDIVLTKPPVFKSEDLDLVRMEAERFGYTPWRNILINLVDNGVRTGIPLEAIFCEDSDGRQGIIIGTEVNIGKTSKEMQGFYPTGAWRYNSLL